MENMKLLIIYTFMAPLTLQTGRGESITQTHRLGTHVRPGVREHAGWRLAAFREPLAHQAIINVTN